MREPTATSRSPIGLNNPPICTCRYFLDPPRDPLSHLRMKTIKKRVWETL